MTGVLCTAWNRLLIKKTKVYCVDGKVSPGPHDVAPKQKFITDPAGINDKNYSHYDLNYSSGLHDTRNKTADVISIKGIELTANSL